MSASRQPLRTFFALWPRDAVRTELARRAASVAKACGGRATYAGLLHLTLMFTGATPRERLPALSQLMDAVDVPAFVLDLDAIGWFRHNGVVWAGTRKTPEPLLALHAALQRGAERLGFSLDVRPYAPHLTLARDASRGPPAVALASLPWDVRSFVLVSSQLAPTGPRYEILHERALDRPARTRSAAGARQEHDGNAAAAGG